MKRLILVALAVAALAGGWSWWGDDIAHAATARPPAMHYDDGGGGGGSWPPPFPCDAGHIRWLWVGDPGFGGYGVYECEWQPWFWWMRVA